MRITHLGHAAVLVETDAARILIDPGNFSDGWHGLTDLDAVLVTHQHPDHLDPEHVPALLSANPRVRVLAEPSVMERVAAGDLPSLGDAAEALGPDAQEAVGDVLVTAVGGRHAVDPPRPAPVRQRRVRAACGGSADPVPPRRRPGHGAAGRRHPGRAHVRAVGGGQGDGRLRPGRGVARGLPDPRRPAERARLQADVHSGERDDRDPSRRSPLGGSRTPSDRLAPTPASVG